MKSLPALILGGVLMTFAASASGAPTADALLLTDFASDASVRWYTVNDGVMGGRSSGGFRLDDGVLIFQGSTNTNGGGFSSIRSRSGAFDLRTFDGIRLRIKADGRRYTFRLTTSTSRRGRYAPSYWADFETRKSADWQVVDVPFERFKPRWRGSSLAGPVLDLRNVDTLGLMIYDKLDGAFRLEADWIKAYRKQPAFSMATYRGKRRPLLVFAPTAADARLVRQLDAIGRTRSLFDERAMTLIVVSANGTSTAGDVRLSPAQAEALRTAYGVKRDAFAVRLVGKDGAVKRKSDDVLAMDTVYALIDTMPMRKREIREAQGDA